MVLERCSIYQSQPIITDSSWTDSIGILKYLLIQLDRLTQWILLLSWTVLHGNFSSSWTDHYSKGQVQLESAEPYHSEYCQVR